MSSKEIAINQSSLTQLLQDISHLVLSARKSVSHSIDLIQVTTNFEIGRRIVEHEQQGKVRAAYGKKILGILSENLTKDFGRGFSEDSLSNMRKFYNIYKMRVPNSETLSRNSVSDTKSNKLSTFINNSVKSSRKLPESSPPFCLSWSHYVFLISIKSPEERDFYEIESASQHWALRELKRQFNSGLYERLALSRDKKGIVKLSKVGHIVNKPSDILKEPLVLEFLGLDEKTRYSESDLESAIIDKLEQFLLELGKGFLFEARQKRFSFDEDHFFVDLVFYNRLLKCYVLIDLKIGKLTHQDLGQMQMYVNYFDRYVKIATEKPSIGIILCKEKHDALVKITLPKGTNIHAKEYQTFLPDKEELKAKLLEWADLECAGL